MAGSLTALVAASVPSAVIVCALSAALVRVDRYRSVEALLAVGALTAAALVFSSAWHLVRPYTGRPDRARAAAFVSLAFVLFALGFTPVRVLLAAAVAGFLTPRRGDTLNESGRSA
jgi:chromate transport protein ChrA